MLEHADPQMHKWNKLLSPSDVAELRSDLQGELVGIGVNIKFDPQTGYISVLGLVPGSPAERAGIAPPDTIVTVDGRLFKGLPERDVVAAIRGKEGETVTLSILRGDKLITVPVVRQKINYDGVAHLALPGDVGYVRIPGFNARTSEGLRDALNDLASKHVTALVIDLRNDWGGSFDDAVAAAGELVPAGSAVVGLKRRGRLESVTPKTTPLLVDLPAAVLVNGNTASSAELLAGALQELRHATVVGSRTHGKWTVQKLEDLPNGYALKYTSAVFQTPGGKSYDGTGMPPDVEVDESEQDVATALVQSDPAKRIGADVQLRTAMKVLARTP
jgi:carboxyl-terminal processing protease